MSSSPADPGREPAPLSEQDRAAGRTQKHESTPSSAQERPGASSSTEGPAAGSAGPSARVWLRPVLMVLVGLAFAALLLAAEQRVAAALMALFALFMGYWTSPLRSGPHLPLAQAASRRADDVAIVLWAPGDPHSARLHTAIRGRRDDVIWVNVDQDPDAQAMLAQVGGREKLPLAIVGEEVRRSVTVGDLLDMRAEGKARAAARSEHSAAADASMDTSGSRPRTDQD